MRNKLTAILIFFGSFSTLGQSQFDSLAENSFKPGFILQVSGTSFLENYNSFDVGIVKDINAKSAIGFEAGYIFNFFALNQDERKSDWFKNVSGFKAYVQYRLYLNNVREYISNSRTFFEFEPGIFIMNYDSERIIGYQCNDEFGDCLYYRYFNSEVNRLVPRLNMKIGKVYVFDPMTVTIFGGVGISHVIDKSDIPTNPEPDKYFYKSGEVNDDLSAGTSVNLRVGVQIGYKFK